MSNDRQKGERQCGEGEISRISKRRGSDRSENFPNSPRREGGKNKIELGEMYRDKRKGGGGVSVNVAGVKNRERE